MFKLQDPHLLIGYFYAVLGTLLFALKSIFIKLAFIEGLTTDSVLLLRMAIALPIYLMIVVFLIKRHKAPLKESKQHYWMILFLGFIGYFLSSWFNLKGLEHISVSLERLTLFTYPIFVTIWGAVFFKSPITKKVIIALCLSFLGLWLVFHQELGTHSGDVSYGTAMVVLSAFSFSFYILFSKNIIKHLGSLWFTSLAMSVSSIVAIVYFVLTLDLSALHITDKAWLWVSLLAIFSTVIPSFLMSEAVHLIGPAHASITGTLGPFFSIALAVSILNEMFTVNHAIGFILVMMGISILTLKKAKQSDAIV